MKQSQGFRRLKTPVVCLILIGLLCCGSCSNSRDLTFDSFYQAELQCYHICKQDDIEAAKKSLLNLYNLALDGKEASVEGVKWDLIMAFTCFRLSSLAAFQDNTSLASEYKNKAVYHLNLMYPGAVDDDAKIKRFESLISEKDSEHRFVWTQSEEGGNGIPSQ